MSGLVLTLKPHEKFLVNGALLENGPKRGQIRIENPNVNILRVSDALRPEEVTTPVRRVYYASQLILSGDVEEEVIGPEIVKNLESLLDVFEGLEAQDYIQRALGAAYEGKYYSILCCLKSVLSIEATMLLRADTDAMASQSAFPHAVAG